MRELLAEIAKVLNEVDARVTLAGHTDTAAFQGGDRGYSNWELSADRANASRRELIAGGMDDRKVLRVVGLAAILPFDQADPGAPVNRRISIVVMNDAAEKRVLSGTELQAGDAQQLETGLQQSGRLPSEDASGIPSARTPSAGAPSAGAPSVGASSGGSIVPALPARPTVPGLAGPGETSASKR